MVKLNEPIGDDACDRWEAEMAGMVEHHKELLAKAADKLESGEELASYEVIYAAAAIRAAADNLRPPKLSKQHRTRKIPEEARVEYWMYIDLQGKSQLDAVLDLSDKYGVTETAMKAFLGLVVHKGNRRRKEQNKKLTDDARWTRSEDYWPGDDKNPFTIMGE